MPQSIEERFSKETYSAVLTKRKHKISFQSDEDDILDGEVEISKNETLKFNILSLSSNVGIEIIAETTEQPKESTEKAISFSSGFYCNSSNNCFLFL